jgi:hypothetical protein
VYLTQTAIGAAIIDSLESFQGRELCPARASYKKFRKKGIDITGQNSLSNAPGSEQAEDFYPVNTSPVRILGNHKKTE